MLRIISFVALAAIIVPSLLYLGGAMPLDAVMWSALMGTVVWFVVTPMWMDRTREVDDAEVQI